MKLIVDKCKVGVLLVLFVTLGKAQRGYDLEYGAGTGVSNYLGDIGGKSKDARPLFLDARLSQSRWNEQLFVRYKFAPLFSARLAWNYLRIEGKDELSSSPGRRYRNLSFRNDIHDFELTGQYLFYTTERVFGAYIKSNIFFTSYIFTGLGTFRHNPKALYQGEWIALQPLQTEGVDYRRWGVCIPMGVGAYFTYTKRRRSHRFGVELNWRYTTTDYLDDVSGSYVDPATLPSELSAVLANRNPEIANQPDGFQNNFGWHGLDADGNPKNKAVRGNKNNKDSYFTLNVSYAISFKRRIRRGGIQILTL